MGKKSSHKRQVLSQKHPNETSAKVPKRLIHDHRISFRTIIIHILLIATIGLIAYSNTFSSPFVFDDVIQIAKNPVIKNLDSFFLLLKGGDVSSLKGYEYNSRRLVGYLTFALNYRIGGLSVTGYHIVNLAIHIANAILLYFLVLFTFSTSFFSYHQPEMSEQPEISSLKTDQHALFTIHYPRFVALVVALFFVSHPIETQAVTYIVQRFTSLATMFYLLSFVMYIKGRLSAQRGNTFSSVFFAICSLLFAVLAMKTKEITFTLPIMIMLYEFVFFRSSLRKKLFALTPILLTLLIIPLSMLHAGGISGELLSDLSEKTRVGTAVPRWDYCITQIRVIATYIRLLLLPAGQNLDYNYPIYHSFFEPPVFLSFLLLLALFGTGVYLLYRSRSAISGQQSAVSGQKLVISSKKEEAIDGGANADGASLLTTHYSLFTIYYSRLIAFGILWFFVTLSVESSIIPIEDVIFEHRLYLPSAGAFIAIAAGLLWLIKKLFGTLHGVEKIGVAVLGVIVVALTITTIVRNSVWKDNIALWQDVVSKSPGKARPVVNLGLAYSGANRLDEAQVLLKKGIDLAPNTEDHFVNLSSLNNKLKRFQLAGEYAYKALKMNPESWEAYINLCSAFLGLQQYDQAMDACRHSIRINPVSVEANNNLSMVYRKLGRYDEAVETAQQAIAFDPDAADPYNNLGLAYVQLKRFGEAGVAFRNALRVNPDYVEAYNNLGGVYLTTGDYRAAKEAFQAALRIDPHYSKANYHLGMVYALEGDKENAIKVYSSLKETAPDEAERLLTFIRAK